MNGREGMLKKELPYFHIGQAYGGCQEWFSTWMMREGGCGAVTACDCCIYLARYRGMMELYPYDAASVVKSDYIRFAEQDMQPYIYPRPTGIDKLETYMDGFAGYLRERGNTRLQMKGWPGEKSLEDTKQIICQQIDHGMPIPCLTLRHKDPSMEPYVWHWYLLTGYQSYDEHFLVKVVTYGEWRWMDLSLIWDTGYPRKGGLILFHDGDGAGRESD